jgi:hypothetical protein
MNYLSILHDVERRVWEWAWDLYEQLRKRSQSHAKSTIKASNSWNCFSPLLHHHGFDASPSVVQRSPSTLLLFFTMVMKVATTTVEKCSRTSAKEAAEEANESWSEVIGWTRRAEKLWRLSDRTRTRVMKCSDCVSTIYRYGRGNEEANSKCYASTR